MPVIKDPGPFTSLFNYEEEQKRLEQRKKQQVEAQQKISRTNALGDAFRLLIDAIGGSKGATIVPRGINPAITQASQEQRRLESDYDTKFERLRMQDLMGKEKDIQYGHALQATEAEREWQGKKLKDQREWENQKIGSTQAFQKEMAGINAKYAKELENVRSANDLTQIQEKYKGEVEKITTKASTDIGKIGGFYVARYDKPDETEVLNREVVIGMFKDLKKYLSDKGTYPSMLPKVLQTENRGNISNDDLRKLIADYPDFFGPRLPQLTGGVSLPPQKEPTPAERRKLRYDEELEKIQTSITLSPRERMKRIRVLQKKNKDILESITEPAIQQLIPAGTDGVMDISPIFK